MRGGLPALVCLALLVAPTGAAVLPMFTAQTVSVSDAEAETQSGLLAHVHGRGPDAELTGFTLAASHLEVWAYADEGVEAGAVGGGHLVNTARALGDAKPQVSSYDDASGAVAAWDPSFTANLFSDVDFAISAVGAELEVRTIRDPVLTRVGIAADPAQEQHDGASSFSAVRRSGDLVRTTMAETSTQFTATGDFVLELKGIDLKVGDTVHEGRDTKQGITGAGDVDGQARTETERFLRVFVTAGTLQIGLGSYDAVAEWVQSEAGATAASRISMVDARADPGAAEAAPRSMEGPVHVRLTPHGERIGVAPVEIAPAATTAFAVPSDLSLILLFALLTLVSLATTVGFATRVLRATPAMDDVEAALEGGAFSRAARMAGKILRRRPHQQDAMLSRAIALSRLGRNGQLVREVQGFLARGKPSDGTLHYVLGLAYMDLGHAKDGQRWLAEAAQRTPDLETQVAQYMDVPRAAAPNEGAYA